MGKIEHIFVFNFLTRGVIYFKCGLDKYQTIKHVLQGFSKQPLNKLTPS